MENLAYDAVCVLSYGGPNGPDDVLPFLRNATAGKNVPDSRLEEVGEHYYARGGVSPINARNAEFVDAITTALHDRGIDVPVVIGNRNWLPYARDVVADLVAQGKRRLLFLATSAYGCYSGCRQYREDIADAVAALDNPGDLTLAKISPFFTSEGFIAANADLLIDAVGNDAARVVFVTHSIPLPMEEASGPQSPTRYGMRYQEQHRHVAARVATRAGQALGRTITWDLAFCSRSGPPHMPWLEPDISDHLATLAADGVERVVVAPIGFVSDHMEVVHDLDTEAAEVAEDLGLRFTRVPTVGIHPAFIAGLVDRLEAKLRNIPTASHIDGEDLARWPSECLATCCLPRPDATAAPAACQQ